MFIRSILVVCLIGIVSFIVTRDPQEESMAAPQAAFDFNPKNIRMRCARGHERWGLKVARMAWTMRELFAACTDDVTEDARSFVDPSLRRVL